MRTCLNNHPLVRLVLRCGPLVLVALFVVSCSAPGTGPGSNAKPIEYTFWPPFPNEPRIQHLVSYQQSSDIAPPEKASALETLVFGAKARDDLPIVKPYGLEMRDGKIYVCDIRAASVVVLDLIKQETRLMGVRGAATLQQPTDIAIADDGAMYVCDKRRRAVIVFDADERFTAVFGWPGFEPVSVAVHGDEIYVCDAQAQQVVVLNRFSGEETRRIGKPGSPDDPYEDRGFGYPLGIAVDEDANVYVSDVMASRVQKFNPDGTTAVVYGVLGDTVGQFRRPKHVDVDSSGQVYVVDAAFQNVQVFAPDGQLLTFFGGAGGYPGAMYLPAGICVVDLDDATRQVLLPYIHPAFNVEHLILVTNQFGPQKVAVYGFGSLKEGMTLDDIVPTRLDTPTGIDPAAVEDETPPEDPEPTPDDKGQP